MSDQKRAAIYARTAISPELGPHFPMAQQIQECKAYAASEGYEVVEEFQEVSSGSSLDRPILQSLLEAAKEGRFEAVILRTFDRLSRRQEQASIIIATLEGYGGRVLSVPEAVLPSQIDATFQKMVAALHEEVAQIEREKISSRRWAGRRAKRTNAQQG